VKATWQTTDDSEQRVDSMIAEGLRIMREAIAQWKPVAIVAGFSSGDDSSVSTHFTLSNFDGSFVFGADPLVGLEASRCHRIAVCERYGWPLELEKATPEGPPQRMRTTGGMVPFDPAVRLPFGKWIDGNTAYEEAVLNYGFPGKGKLPHSLMYRRLKESPICRMLKRFKASKVEGKPKVLIVSGVRHDESAIRAGYKVATALGNFGDVWVNPFYFRTAMDFEAYRQEFSIPRNPVKAQCGISGECCCGTFGEADERAAYRAVDPSFADYLDGLESRVKSVGFPWGWGENPPRWWVNAQRDKKSGQLSLFSDDLPTFQPMCVGCNNGRR
jgi:3'-phosphoadenosine 5'-phosphosulfate sulfotransferase (PAPS reductase)/FAD synthetase